MGKSIGLWNASKIEYFDYTLVAYEEYEFCELYLPAELNKKCKIFRLQQSVKVNREVFVWYLHSTYSQEKLSIESKCLDSASGHLITLLQEFLQAFNNLDVECCKRIQKGLLDINLANYYLYRTKWLIDELTTFSEILQEFFINTSPLALETELDFKLWWQRPLAIQGFLDRFQSSCDLENIRSRETLECISNIYNNFSEGLEEWSHMRGLEKLEAASGYFLVLAEYWFRRKNYQLSLLCTHRSVDCVLHLIGAREGVVIPDTNERKLLDDRRRETSYYKIFKALTVRRNRSFGVSTDFIEEINKCRNGLREVHGFRVVSRQEVYEYIEKCNFFLKNLAPEVNSSLYKDKFDIHLNLPLKAIFEIEQEMDSYISKLE